MAATVSIAETNGTAPGTETASITNSNMGDADAVNLVPADYPVAPGTNSFEKWQKFNVCGDCCRAPYYGMTLTQEELDLLPIKLDIVQVGKDKFRARGSVCPLFLNSECSVYEIRPCQCRLFHCGRILLTDAKLATIVEIQKMMEQDPEYREFKASMDEEAIIWGNAHGWNWKKMK